VYFLFKKITYIIGTKGFHGRREVFSSNPSLTKKKEEKQIEVARAQRLIWMELQLRVTGVRDTRYIILGFIYLANNDGPPTLSPAWAIPW
jgi:hypothetical protein